MNGRLAVLLAGVFAAVAAAQDPAGDPVRRRIDAQAQTMREQIEQGQALRSHVRIVVRLKNGNRLRGIVKDGRLVERIDGLRFVDAQAKDPGAGVRLWYSSGRSDYVFVPFGEFAEYRVLERLSQKQLEQLEQELQVAEAKRKAAETPPAEPAAAAEPTPGAEQGPPAAPAQEPAPKRGKATGRDAKPEADAAAKDQAKDKAKEQHQRWYALLQDYPPKAGWNAAKRDQIQRKMAVIGVKPTAAEQRFVDEFAEWQKACEHFGTTREGAAGSDSGTGSGDQAGPGATPPATDGKTRRRRS